MNYNLERYLQAQKESYTTALVEIRNGRKQSHWMWYIFPQIKDLGYSETSKYYAIHDIDEAKAYLRHEILGARLLEITEALLKLKETNPALIFGSPDYSKLKSSMTLFAKATEQNNSVFHEILKKYYQGKMDRKTIEILKDCEE